jgi:leucine-zipper of insertion element IS481
MAGHPNAPPTPEGRLRLRLCIDAGRPIAHVAAEAGSYPPPPGQVVRPPAGHGEEGLLDRSSRPSASPTGIAQDIADLVEALPRQTKHGPPGSPPTWSGCTASPSRRTPCTASCCRLPGSAAGGGGRIGGFTPTWRQPRAGWRPRRS